MKEDYKVLSTETTSDELNKTLMEIQDSGRSVLQIIPVPCGINMEGTDEKYDGNISMKMIVVHIIH